MFGITYEGDPSRVALLGYLGWRRVQVQRELLFLNHQGGHTDGTEANPSARPCGDAFLEESYGQ